MSDSAVACTPLADRVRPVVRDVLSEFRRPFTKREAVNAAFARAPWLQEITTGIFEVLPTMDVHLLVRKEVGAIVVSELHRRQRLPHLDIRVRLFEQHDIGISGQRIHRWRPLKAMTMTELQLCLDWRRKNVARQMPIIRAYEIILNRMMELNAATVEEAMVA